MDGPVLRTAAMSHGTRGGSTGGGTARARPVLGASAVALAAGLALSGAFVLGPMAPANAASVTSMARTRYAGHTRHARRTNHAAHAKTVRLSAAEVSHVGEVLTTAGGLTLYRFTANPRGKSTCVGTCAHLWPPLLAAKGTKVEGPHGVKDLSLIKVSGNQWQVAWHGVALYRYVGDSKKGEANGQGLLGKWFAVPKSGIPAHDLASARGSTTTTRPRHRATTTTSGGGYGY